ncbi:hypothetical protein [Streptomyces sp. NPDC012888]|uniref:hypothetical protein n=1 Tax=Streptomyces sp. NPDC012888 TaxID=3364855 RepID=UPI0036C398CC
MAVVLVSGALVPAVLGGGVGAVAAPAAATAPVLEKVSPTGAIEVVDDKGYSCFWVTVKGHGFAPDVVTEKDGVEVHSSVVRLEVGTDQAMGVLSGEPDLVYPDKDGNFEARFRPCGLTTHGSIETDHVCTQEDVDASTCPINSVGDVTQRSRRWVSTKVRVVARDDVCEKNGLDEDDCKERRRSRELPFTDPVLAEVTWPLKVTGKK